MSSPLQNRVLPTGEIVALADRGLVMGNRGGRIHDPATRTLLTRRWSSRRWICCVTQFKGRQRRVMGQSYTELFFLDEVTALAAGHRPCFECRRADAKRFALNFQNACLKADPSSPQPSADVMDVLLHQSRLDGRLPRRFTAPLHHLPHGSMFEYDGQSFARYQDEVLLWTPSGYVRPKASPSLSKAVSVLTPEVIVETLRQGYCPMWHPSAGASHL